jgi:hypothetical protein
MKEAYIHSLMPLNDWQTNSMELSTTREATSCEATRQFPIILPHSQELSTCTYPEETYAQLMKQRDDVACRLR